MREAAVAAAVAVLTGTATAADDAVEASAKQYGRNCYQQKYKCGLDYDKCSYQYGVCVQYGCNKEVSFSCPYKAKEKYDCNKTYDEQYKVKERRSYQDTQWVKGGCEKDGKVKYDCNKTYNESCKKQREVTYKCTKTQTVNCKKERDATCTRRVNKQCYGSPKTESYPCSKVYKKEVRVGLWVTGGGGAVGGSLCGDTRAGAGGGAAGGAAAGWPRRKPTSLQAGLMTDLVTAFGVSVNGSLCVALLCLLGCFFFFFSCVAPPLRSTAPTGRRMATTGRSATRTFRTSRRAPSRWAAAATTAATTRRTSAKSRTTPSARSALTRCASGQRRTTRSAR